MSETYIDNSPEARRARLTDDVRLYGGSIVAVAGIAEAILSEQPIIKGVSFLIAGLSATQGIPAGMRSLFAERHWATPESQVARQQNSEIEAAL